MDIGITPLDKIQECIKLKKNFVLQGGAGSGKTETLKQVLEFISKTYPEKKIACITHTNLAVDEIKSRVGNQHTICTIHSFLNDIIKNFKKSIHQVIFEIFKLEKMERLAISSYTDVTEQKKKEHEKYKKIYEKYSTRLFALKKERVSKVEGKREYDVNPENFNNILNPKIEALNREMLETIQLADFNKIKYNESRYDNYKELSFGHNSLLKISFLLFEKYEILGRIIKDKFDFVFIDEYQDTNSKIIEVFLKRVPSDGKTIIGLFGDSMQAIYEDGIGDVEEYVKSEDLLKIIKEDNYRCSEQVVTFINQIRNDGLKQTVAFKIKDGITENISNRQGTVKLYYAIYDDKPNAFSEFGLKEKYYNALNKLIAEAQTTSGSYKSLMLTNKSISSEVGFKNLYNVYNARYLEVHEEIEKDLIRLQLFDLAALCNAYTAKVRNNNFILTELKKSGYPFKSIEDKVRIKEFFDLIISSNKNVIEIVEMAFENKILKKADKFTDYIIRKDNFLKDLAENIEFQNFKPYYNAGQHTFTKISATLSTMSEDEFKEYERLLKKEIFYSNLFSDKINFNEVIAYFKYINEETQYITMHKTKGSGIDNVLVVLDEYFWNKYSFKTIFDGIETDLTQKLTNQKLFYVACSRAKTNLICVKLISSDEEANIKSYFSNVVKVEIDSN
jgi:DNA helicase-2/ATP-dependent DNA helicase PcrA